MAQPSAPKTHTAPGAPERLRQGRRLHGDLILGIRPEDISLSDQKTNGHQTPEIIPSTVDSRLSGQIILTEHMGSSNIYFVRVGNHRFVVTSEADQFFPQDANVHLRLNNAKLHFFHPEHGNNLELAG